MTLTQTLSPPFSRRRRPTRRVLVGDVAVGADEPIRIQSMTTTSTRDVEATARQVAGLAEAGCEIVRVTVPTTQDAEALEPLRRRLDDLGVTVPIVADIHFNPRAAMLAADHCEKVRINPGNYVDTKRFAVREYTDREYSDELDRIRERFTPLVEKCRRLGRAMRIGTNHGSLSDRIMNRHGDTPLGMVESALEFLRVCEELDYGAVILSMKSSNPFVAVRAYRLLAERMALEGMDHPFHLGVTEAGDGEDGRIKSAVGMGSLLADGIGDTIRVSLTEDPRAEVPVARALAALHAPRAEPPEPPEVDLGDPRRPEPHRRETAPVRGRATTTGGVAPVQVWLDLGAAGSGLPAEVALPGAAGPLVPDVLHAWARADDEEGLDRLADWLAPVGPDRAVTADVALAGSPALARADIVLWRAPQASDADAWEAALRAAVAQRSGRATGISVDASGTSPRHASLPLDHALARSLADAAQAAVAESGAPVLLALVPPAGHDPLHAVRLLVALLEGSPAEACPVVLVDAPSGGEDERLLAAASHLGGLLVDGIGDAVRLDGHGRDATLRTLSGILQATRLRMSRPDYISCPSCGRTLFDLEETTARIKSVTGHLAGVKIAVMGCIVNGPGEMADADFGYVGSSPGKVNLYVERTCVEKNVPAAEAPERLVDLIKSAGMWREPPEPPGS